MKISKVLRILSNICIALTVLICLVFSVFTVPRLFGVTPFVVQSSSMEPAIHTGSVVFTNRKDTDVKKGDIITFSLTTGDKSGVFVTHRVNDIDKERGLIQTKGDNNDKADGWLDKSAITGTVLFSIPKVGFILNSLQEAGFVILAIWVFVINAVLMLASRLVSVSASEKSSAAEADEPKREEIDDSKGYFENMDFKVKVTTRNMGLDNKE